MSKCLKSCDAKSDRTKANEMSAAVIRIASRGPRGPPSLLCDECDKVEIIVTTVPKEKLLK
jgi:hypothetical protein